jgi:hypothetical protein
MAGGWADAGNAPVVGGVTAPDTATTSDQIQDALKQLPADQKTALFALDKAVPLNTLNSAQIGNLKGLSADELNNLAKLAPQAVKSMLAQSPDTFKRQIQQLDQRGWGGTNDRAAPANGKAWADGDADDKKTPDAKKAPDAKKDDDTQRKLDEAKKQDEARAAAQRFIEHVKTMNKAQQDALLACVHNMI